MNKEEFLISLKYDNTYLDLKFLKKVLNYNSKLVEFKEYNFEMFENEIKLLIGNQEYFKDENFYSFYDSNLEKHVIILNKLIKKNEENYRILIAKAICVLFENNSLNFEEILISNIQLIDYIINNKEVNFTKISEFYKLPIEFIEQRFESFSKYLETNNR